MTDAQFAEWWSRLSSTLKPDTEVFHWSAQSQYQLNGSFRVVKFESDRVWIDITKPTLPATKTVQKVTLKLEGNKIKYIPVGHAWEVPIRRVHDLRRENFIKALRRWNEYSSLTISRKSLEEGGSTYVISIIHWLEVNSR